MGLQLAGEEEADVVESGRPVWVVRCSDYHSEGTRLQGCATLAVTADLPPILVVWKGQIALVDWILPAYGGKKQLRTRILSLAISKEENLKKPIGWTKIQT